MRICVLDGIEIRDRGQLHALLASSLGFPDWYGRNLDALYDCLTTDTGEDIKIQILHRQALHEGLKGYAQVLEKVLHAAAEANPRLEIDSL